METENRITQKKLIHEHLKRYDSIEPMTALREYGCYRLSGRISELRSEGINIRTLPAISRWREVRQQVLSTAFAMQVAVRRMLTTAENSAVLRMFVEDKYETA